MSGTLDRAEALRQEGLALLRNNDPEQAITRFEAAIDVATDDVQVELIRINKSFADISLQRTTPEVQDLPKIVFRRRSQKHVLLAAYNLMYKFRLEQNYERARFYGNVALEAAEQDGDLNWTPEILIQLGNICVFDSLTSEALDRFNEVLALVADDPEKILTRAAATQNVGYCLLLEGEPRRGVERIHEAIALMHEADTFLFLAESHIDLCLGYLELGELETARHYGELGLAEATEHRQVRNAHYLLGEVAYKRGDMDDAEKHFSILASDYPEFPHLKNLLLAIDLRSMVNWKLS